MASVFQNLLGTLSSTFRIGGIGGYQLNAVSSSVISATESDGSTFAELRIATPTNSDPGDTAVTKSFSGSGTVPGIASIQQWNTATTNTPGGEYKNAPATAFTVGTTYVDKVQVYFTDQVVIDSGKALSFWMGSCDGPDPNVGGSGGPNSGNAANLVATLGPGTYAAGSMWTWQIGKPFPAVGSDTAVMGWNTDDQIAVANFIIFTVTSSPNVVANYSL